MHHENNYTRSIALVWHWGYAQTTAWHASYDCYLVKQGDTLKGNDLKGLIGDVARMQIRYDVYADSRFIYGKATVASSSPEGIHFTGNEIEEVLLDKKTAIFYKITGGVAVHALMDSLVTDSAARTFTDTSGNTAQMWQVAHRAHVLVTTSAKLPPEVTPVIYLSGLRQGVEQVNTDTYVMMLRSVLPDRFDFQKLLVSARAKCKQTERRQNLF